MATGLRINEAPSDNEDTDVVTSWGSKALSYAILAVLMCGVVWFLYHNT
jgi:hypothetical protein